MSKRRFLTMLASLTPLVLWAGAAFAAGPGRGPGRRPPPPAARETVPGTPAPGNPIAGRGVTLVKGLGSK